MSENLKKKFLYELQDMIDQELQNASNQIRDKFDENKATVADELSVILHQTSNHYRKLFAEGRVGQLYSIYFSFLRSSMLDDYPAYRIDFYDETDCLSMIECSEMWAFSFVFSHFEKIKNKVQTSLQSQNKVKAYEADCFIFALYQQFHRIAQSLLPELFSMTVAMGTGIDNVAAIEVRMGELFDDTVIIYSNRNT